MQQTSLRAVTLIDKDINITLSPKILRKRFSQLF